MGAFFVLGGFYFYYAEAGDGRHIETRRLVLGVMLDAAMVPILVGSLSLARLRGAGARIEIADDGVCFGTGGQTDWYPWTDFVEVDQDLRVLFRRVPSYRTIGALLLVRPPGMPRGRFARWRLRRISERNHLRPRDGWRVTMLPLARFSPEDADAIVDAAREADAKATRATRGAGPRREGA